jgi:hypothetical protein
MTKLRLRYPQYLTHIETIYASMQMNGPCLINGCQLDKRSAPIPHLHLAPSGMTRVI